MRCRICDSEFNENENLKSCPVCGENYFVITLTEYQKLVEYIQTKQDEIEQIYKQVVDESFSSNKFKTHLSRERDIYGGFNAWINLIMEEFNIPKEKKLFSKPYYDKPMSCQLHPNKVCNRCGDC